MVVRYSSLNRFEVPNMSLCSPGSTYTDGHLTNVVGVLCDHEAEELALNFNATSELNLRVNRVKHDDPDENAYAYNLYRSLQNRRLIFVEDIGFFMITEVTDGYDNGQSHKDVRAESCDIEIEQKMVPYIADGTYPFTTQTPAGGEPVKGIIETVVETLPLWTIGYVDEAVASKWRTFEDVNTETNCLTFLLSDVQDAYECIILFDIINRTINVYDQNNYVRRTNIHLTKDDLINSLDISESAEDLYTALTVMGDEDVTIAAINPLGTNTIYDFGYYTDWMTPQLGEKVTAWASAVDAARDGYYALNLEYYQKLEQASNLRSEIGRINIQMTMYQRCRDNIVATDDTNMVGSYNTVIIENGGTAIEVYQEIADTLDEIDRLIGVCQDELAEAESDLSDLNAEIEAIKEQIDAVHADLALSEHFTDDELGELQNYIFEGNYSDEYVTFTDIMTYSERFEQMKILYDRAVLQMRKISRPSQEFSVSVDNFLFVKEFEAWAEQLETGCLVDVELERDDVAALFLSNFTVNYDDHALNMTFGNRFNRYDQKSLFDNVLGSVSRSANTLSYVKDILYPIKNGELNVIREALQASRDLTMGAALTSTNEEVIIDGSGYTGRRRLANGEYDPRQVKITGKSIVLTDDAWDSSKVAIGEINIGGETVYGVNASVLIGDLIMGNALRILDDEGNDMFTVVDGRISSAIGPVNSAINSVRGDVASNAAATSALETGLEALSTQQQQTASDFTWQVNRVSNAQQQLSEALDDTNGTLQEFQTYMQFDQDGLTIGRTESKFRTRMDDDKLSFLSDGSEIAYMSNDKLYINQAEVLTTLILGSYAFTPQSNGNLSLIFTETPFVITTQPVSVAGSDGDACAFSVTASAVQSYQWQYSSNDGSSWSNSTATGNKTATLQTEFNTSRRKNIYRCKLTSTYGTTQYTNSVRMLDPA